MNKDALTPYVPVCSKCKQESAPLFNGVCQHCEGRGDDLWVVTDFGKPRKYSKLGVTVTAERHGVGRVRLLVERLRIA